MMDLRNIDQPDENNNNNKQNFDNVFMLIKTFNLNTHKSVPDIKYVYKVTIYS